MITLGVSPHLATLLYKRKTLIVSLLIALCLLLLLIKDLREYSIFLFSFIVVLCGLLMTLNLDIIRKPVCEMQGGTFNIINQTCHSLPLG